MKKYFTLILLLFIPIIGKAQISNDKIYNIINNQSPDYLIKMDYNMLVLSSVVCSQRLDTVYRKINHFKIDFPNQNNDTIAYQKRTELKNQYINWLELLKKTIQIRIDRNDPLEKHRDDLFSSLTDIEKLLPNNELPREISYRLGYINLLSISSFYNDSKSIKKTIKLIKSENKKGNKSKYDIGENQINSFGYELLNSNKNEEALSVFIINTKLYPNGFNTFDSLGECLLLLNKKDEGIEAYKKSLALNPNNENAKKIISEMK